MTELQKERVVALDGGRVTLLSESGSQCGARTDHWTPLAEGRLDELGDVLAVTAAATEPIEEVV